MKTKNACILLLAALTMTACDYDDSALWEQVNQNTERIAALKAWQVETNTNIQSLQTLLSTADYITAVTPITENEVEVGYTITFLNSPAVTIYNGKKGEKGEKGDTGATGAAGATPQIGVTQGEDGNWYWTLNGELLTDTEGNPIRANGEKGDKGDTGDTGAQGPQGEQGDTGDTGDTGATGTSAPVPQLKTGASLTNVTQDTQGDTIKPEAIYLSVDGGKTWTRVSGEDGTDGTDGTDGKDGKDGDSFFSKVDTSDPTCVTFTLADGTTSFSVPRYTGIKVDFGDASSLLMVFGETETVNFTAEGSDQFTTDNLFIIAPDGWKAEISLQTRTSTAFTLTITTPTDATSGAAEGEILVMLDNGQGSTTIGRLTVKAVKYIIDGTTLTAGGLEAGELDTAIGDRSDLTSITVTSGTLNETDWAAVVKNNAALLYLDLAGATYEGTDKDNLAYSYSKANGLPLLTVQLPQGITALGEDAFYGCKALTSITLPEGLDSIGGDAFFNCYALESIDLPEGVTSIGKSAFQNCTSLPSIDLPDGLKSIGDYAFDNCKALTSIDLPEGVTIGEFACGGCSVLTSIDLPETLTSIEYGAFHSCTSLTSIDLPEGVTTIEESAFQNCPALPSITLPDKVTSIGNFAFAYCTSLTSITLPDKVTSIGNFAFAYCTSLTSITLPDKVTSIGNFAFTECSALTSITCLATTPPTVSSIAFEGCTNLTAIYVPDGSVGTYKKESGWRAYSDEIKPISEKPQ